MVDEEYGNKNCIDSLLHTIPVAYCYLIKDYGYCDKYWRIYILHKYNYRCPTNDQMKLTIEGKRGKWIFNCLFLSNR